MPAETPITVPTKKGAGLSGKRTLWGSLKWPLAAVGLVLLFNLIFTPGFFHIEFKNGRLYGSLIDILNRASPVMLLSLGMTLVIATGGVDLSVGAVMAISGALGALLITRQSFGLALAVALGASLCAGFWNGALVAFLKVQPIVATLILMVAGRGIAQLISGGQILTFEHRGFEYIGQGNFLTLPFPVILALSVAVLAWALTRKTALGLFIEALGDNELASRYAGVPTNLVRVLVYAFCGLCAGLAGLIVAANIKAADSNNAGLWLELDAILAVVIGGTPLTGGRFHLPASLVGAVLIQALTTTILTRSVPVEYTLVVKALVILGVCLLQSEKFRAAFTRGAPSA